jgi:hypothetical protein
MLTKIRSIKANRVSVVLVATGMLMALVGQLFVAKPAKADCKTPDGRAFATGDKVGPYVCMPDGTWKTY